MSCGPRFCEARIASTSGDPSGFVGTPSSGDGDSSRGPVPPGGTPRGAPVAEVGVLLVVHDVVERVRDPHAAPRAPRRAPPRGARPRGRTEEARDARARDAPPRHRGAARASPSARARDASASARGAGDTRVCPDKCRAPESRRVLRRAVRSAIRPRQHAEADVDRAFRFPRLIFAVPVRAVAFSVVSSRQTRAPLDARASAAPARTRGAPPARRTPSRGPRGPPPARAVPRLPRRAGRRAALRVPIPAGDARPPPPARRSPGSLPPPRDRKPPTGPSRLRSRRPTMSGFAGELTHPEAALPPTLAIPRPRPPPLVRDEAPARDPARWPSWTTSSPPATSPPARVRRRPRAARAS